MRRIASLSLPIAAILAQLSASAVAGEPGVILPMRERAAVIDGLLEQRLERIVPELMREQSVDMWIIIGREYNEDPVLKTMLPATWLSARRRTILVFHDPGPASELERLAVVRYSVGDLFESAWDPEEQPDQWARLVEIIEERDPQRIALNISPTFALADGLTHSQYVALMESMPNALRERIVSGERLAVGWLERRLPEEMDVYASVCRIAHEIMAEALSERVIQPGVTTTDDVKWWCRERVRELGLIDWFHPIVSVQRHEATGDFMDMMAGGEQVIRRGDLIHLDFGITYLRLNTDTQQMAYVLRRGETAPPEGIREAFRIGNEMQDILTSRIKEGRTGNEVLLNALGEASARGIDAMVYTHPIGFHGHAAGPAIGMWDKQGGVPGTGEYPIHNLTAYSIELSIKAPVAEWGGQEVRIMLEEDAVFEDGRVEYIDGRQTALHVIR
ncbi:MAG: M24 family metallopeptidase [Planctomycetota bacterium]|nr:M24 family metallopeptidase [Planctomycetota bacterium]